MNPSALRHFLEVAEAGSFRRAGESLRLAASALNRQISLLEAEIGAPLFERSRGRKRLRLTSAGQILVQYARSAVDEIEQARYEIDALKGLRAGNIIVGVPLTFAREFFPQFLARFQATYPHISYRVFAANSAHVVDKLQADEIEIGFLYRENVPSSLEAIVSVERERYLMMRADHPLATRRWVRLSEIAGYPIIIPDYSVGTREIYDRVFSKLRVKPRVVMTTSSYEMLRSMARVGLGLAIVNEYLMPLPDSPDADSNVAFVRVRDLAIRPEMLWCCIRRGRRLSDAALAFVERAKAELQVMRRVPRGAPIK